MNVSILHKRLTPWLVATAFGLATLPPAAAQNAPQIEESYATALIRDALLAVNHANWTGNYTTLRDYGSAAFHDANTATDLAARLQRVRDERLDLLPVMSVAPVIQRSDVSLDQRIIRLTGYFPLQPRSITFDLEFVRQDDRWLIYGLAVGAFETPPPDPAPTAQVDTPPAQD